MIADFAQRAPDFCRWMYCVIDELWQPIAPLFHRPGPAPACADSEVITMALSGACCGWDQETELISNWQRRPDLFPHVPERSRCNRRRCALQQGSTLLRRLALRLLDLAQDRHCASDRIPVPVVQFHLVPGASHAWKADGASFGTVAPNKQTIFGSKLHLLVTVHGVILEFARAPAQVSDLAVGAAVLAEHDALTVLGDTGDSSAPWAAELAATRGISLLTPPRRTEVRHLPEGVTRLGNARRQISETVHDQLTEQFHLSTNHAYRFRSLCARLYTKLTAHTLCIYLNRLLGNSDCLQIKRLAFPI